MAAKNYFEPVLNGFSKKIAGHVAEMKSCGKGVKQYITELKDLDLLFYGQLGKIYKSMALVSAAIENKELTKTRIKMPPRSHMTAAADTGPTSLPENGSRKSSRRKYRPDTREITLEMFSSGKAIHDIAAERSLKISTIRGIWLLD